MAILNILRYPDARLHKAAAAVTVFDDQLKQLARDLAENPAGDEESERYDRLTNLLDHGHPSLSRFLDRLGNRFSTPM